MKDYIWIRSSLRWVMVILVLIPFIACKKIESDTTDIPNTSIGASLQFASGTKAVRINTSKMSGSSSTGSFTLPSSISTSKIIPTGYPGADGTSTYNPGISAVNYFNLDGVTGISKPDWLVDFQVGITGLIPNTCATFGSGTPMDPIHFFRTSEYDCSTFNIANNGVPVSLGTGNSQNDKVFFRIVLNRDPIKLGTAENLLVQVEYQASAIRLNSDGSSNNVEENLDQLWKIFWKESLASSTSPNVFSVFIPPNYSACANDGTGTTSSSMKCPNSTPNDYRGSPVQTRQFMIPLSAYPSMKVIQFSRVRSRANNSPFTTSATYIDAFCEPAEPLCLGVVIRSVTLMRI